MPNLVDYQFTAKMEDDLDAISRGEAGHIDYLRGFYFGNEPPDFPPTLYTRLGDPRHYGITVSYGW